jgi:hypothetical protein
MPVLGNVRHERFAQELAKGKTQEQAYIDAGYASGDARAKASRLLATNGNIAARVVELQTVVAEKSTWDAARIINNLARYAEKGEAIAEPAGLSVARASMMDIGKLLGLIVDKGESKQEHNVQVQVIERKIVRPNAAQTDD